MKRIIITIFITSVMLITFTGCVGDGRATDRINVVSREEGSGTRDAFVELFGIESEDSEGKKVDIITEDANTTNSTAVMMMTVASDINAIGYISLGSLNKSIKALEIDGKAPSADNIKNGAYKISRQLSIVVKDDLSLAAADFISFMLSPEGQSVVEKSGYVPMEKLHEYEPKNVSGKLSVAGSSSVTPIMEKLKEAYKEKNPDVRIEVQQNDSTTGINSVVAGICDIGMTSRGLREAEREKGIREIMIARDGIVVIVNNASDVASLTAEQVKRIFMGEITVWSDIAS